MRSLVLKRLFDFFVSSVALIVFSPLIVILAICVRVFLGTPVFFVQLRPGYQGRSFPMVKFRTMTTKKNQQGALLPDAERLTSFGRFLRQTSLDELPELWNVWKGDMSLVGPRPLLMQYIPRYNEFQQRRHEVRPGITGWAQVNGRNALDWNEKFKLDVWYVDHWNLFLDIKILCLTVLKMFMREGINQPGQATAEEFLGNSQRE